MSSRRDRVPLPLCVRMNYVWNCCLSIVWSLPGSRRHRFTPRSYFTLKHRQNDRDRFMHTSGVYVGNGSWKLRSGRVWRRSSEETCPTWVSHLVWSLRCVCVSFFFVATSGRVSSVTTPEMRVQSTGWNRRWKHCCSAASKSPWSLDGFKPNTPVVPKGSFLPRRCIKNKNQTDPL